MHWQNELAGLISGEILLNEPLSRHTSMGVGGNADAFVRPDGVEELGQLVRFFKNQHIPFIPIGNGTNLIVKDKGYRGAVISLQGLQGKRLEVIDNETVLISAQAGLPLQELINLTLEEELTGAEFCAGIPGSVGGAVIMNAGAYGREMKDCVSQVTIIEDNGTTKTLAREELVFQYRRLQLPADVIIVSACFLLKRDRKRNIQEKISEILKLRGERHPLNYKSAGSVFKNPPGLSAGQIVEELGLKGLRLGEAQISLQHGNFLVNLGQATAMDMIILIDLIKEAAWARMKVKLETEVKIIGEE